MQAFDPLFESSAGRPIRWGGPCGTGADSERDASQRGNRAYLDPKPNAGISRPVGVR